MSVPSDETVAIRKRVALAACLPVELTLDAENTGGRAASATQGPKAFHLDFGDGGDAVNACRALAMRNDKKLWLVPSKPTA